MSSFQVRAAQERDLEQVLALYDELAEGDPDANPLPHRVLKHVLAP